MRWILVLLVVAAVFLVWSWGFPPPPAPSTPAPGPEATDPLPTSSGTSPLPAPSPAPRRGPVPRPLHPLGPQPPGGAGEILRTDLRREDAENVEATRKRLSGTEMGPLEWKTVGLRAALDRIAEKSGVPCAIEGEGLDDEPVMVRSPGVNALDLVRDLAMQRTLRFEITAERVIVKR